MFKKMLPVALAAATFAVPASAATIVNVTANPVNCTGPVCSYSISGSTDETQFSQTATFMVPMLGMISGAATSTAVKIGDATDVEFSLVRLTDPNGKKYDFEIFNGLVDIAILEPSGAVAGEYTLLLEGTSGGNGSFGGNLSFGAVPEASTWALMILGFGLVGGALRRSKVRPALTYA